VRYLLDPGDRRFPRVGNAEREDGGPAAVLAVGGRERKGAIVLPPRGFPLAAVAHLYACLFGEGGKPLLHLESRGNHVGAVHEGDDGRLVFRRVADEAVVVVPLVVSRAGLEGRVGFRPREQPLVDREGEEHPAWAFVARDERVLDAEAREEIARLQAAGPAPDDDHWVFARRKGLLS
jgi:hypothetical protein